MGGLGSLHKLTNLIFIISLCEKCYIGANRFRGIKWLEQVTIPTFFILPLLLGRLFPARILSPSSLLSTAPPGGSTSSHTWKTAHYFHVSCALLNYDFMLLGLHMKHTFSSDRKCCKAEAVTYTFSQPSFHQSWCFVHNWYLITNHQKVFSEFDLRALVTKFWAPYLYLKWCQYFKF